MSIHRWGRRWRPGLGPAIGIGSLALWARLAVWREVIVAERVLPRDPDAHYHLRRIEQISAHFPRVPVRDPGLNWPDGAACPWAPGFDWLGALLAGPAAWLGGIPVERAAAFYPVLLGLGLVAATAAVARFVAPAGRQGGHAVLFAALLAALLPRLVHVSQLGRVDHHVFEGLSMLALGTWLLWAAAETPEPARTRSQWWLFEAVGGALAFAAGAGFTGSILYVAIAGAVLMGLRLCDPRPPDRRAWGVFAGSGALAFAAAGLALAPIHAWHVTRHGEALSFRYPSHLQPLLYLAAAFACAAAAWASRRAPHTRGPWRRIGIRVGALAAVGLGAAALLAPIVGAEVRAGLFEWLAHRDPWLATIAEFQPLLPASPLWSAANARALYDYNALPGLFAPVVVPLGLWCAVRTSRRVGLAFAAWTLALVPLTLVQNRFGQVSSANFAVCGGLVVAWGAHGFARRLGGRRLRPALAGAATIGFLCLLDPAIRHSLRWHAPRRPDAVESVALYLAALPRDPAAPGVLARWSHGHALLRLAQRPVLTAGFGPWTGAEAFRASEQFVLGREEALYDLLAARRLRWVVTGMEAPFPRPGDRPDDPGKPFVLFRGDVRPSPAWWRRAPLTSLWMGGGGLPELDVPHVSGLRPRYASPQGATGLGFPLQRLWLYERVPGATLTGAAPAGARVVARLARRVHGVEIPYVAWTRADTAGRYRLVLPLPSGVREPAFQTGDAYALSFDGVAAGSVAVSESSVVGGGLASVGPWSDPDRSEPRATSSVRSRERDLDARAALDRGVRESHLRGLRAAAHAQRPAT